MLKLRYLKHLYIKIYYLRNFKLTILMDIIDLFAINFQFNYKNKLNFSTGFTQMLSFIFIVVSLFAFIWNLVYMIQKNDFSINSYQTDISLDNKVIFNETNSFLGFSLFDENFDIFPLNSTILKYLKITAYSVILNSSNNLNYPLKIRNCNESLNKHFLNSDPNNTINSCIDFNNSLLQGNLYSFSNSNFFTLEVDFDKNSYLNETNLTNSFLGYIYIYFPISSINLYNYTNPYDISIGGNYYSLSLNQSKTNLMPFSIDEIHTDTSFIGSSDRKDIILSSKYNYRTQDNFGRNFVFRLVLYIDPIKTIYYRSYMKFQGVLNNVNSIVSILSIVFKFLGSYFNKIKLRQNFIEEDFLFKDDSKTDFLKNDLNLNMSGISIEEDKRNDNNYEKDSIKKFKSNDFKVLHSDYEKLDFDNYSWSDIYLLNNICDKSKKESNIFSPIYEFYESIIDVNNILIKLHKIDFIKENTNLKENKILLKIRRKVKNRLNELNVIKTFKIQRNKYKINN